MSDTPTPSQAAEKAIREALEAGATSAFYTHPRDDNRWRENERLALACNPEAMTALLSQLAEMRAKVERLKSALVQASACIRWHCFGECRTERHKGAPPQPADIAKMLDELLSATEVLGGRDL